MVEHTVQLRCTSTRERVGAKCLNSETTRSCGFLAPRGYTDPFQFKSENREKFETGHCDRSSVNSSKRHSALGEDPFQHQQDKRDDIDAKIRELQLRLQPTRNLAQHRKEMKSKNGNYA